MPHSTILLCSPGKVRVPRKTRMHIVVLSFGMKTLRREPVPRNSLLRNSTLYVQELGVRLKLRIGSFAVWTLAVACPAASRPGPGQAAAAAPHATHRAVHAELLHQELPRAQPAPIVRALSEDGGLLGSGS